MNVEWENRNCLIRHSEKRYDEPPLPYRYDGKELEAMNGLNQYDSDARRRFASIPVTTTMDPMCEKYYPVSPYAWCNNNPVNAIDTDGKLVIFINGMNAGSGGSAKYWEGFDNAVMKHLNDYNALYRDGSLGGVLALPDNLSASNRQYIGEVTGIKDAEKIIKLISDKNGNIKETIKIITHSMGAAYAKGYVKALMDYFKKNNISTDFLEYEADFAPFQPTNQKAVEGVDTYQFSHKNDKIAGSEPMEGAIYQDSYNESNQGNSITSHSISSFWNQVNNLPTGNYKVVNGQIVPQ